MSRRKWAAAAIVIFATLASALWIEPAAVAATGFVPCGRPLKRCLPFHSPKCLETKWVVKYINGRKYNSTCCAKWQCVYDPPLSKPDYRGVPLKRSPPR
jgi:hypothetical protein